jgi:phage shock protein E
MTRTILNSARPLGRIPFRKLKAPVNPQPDKCSVTWVTPDVENTVQLCFSQENILRIHFLNIQKMGFLSKLFGQQVDIAGLISKGAKVIDVRSPQEFAGGHVKGSVNVPLDRIRGEIPALKKAGVPVILCCASGMRSGNATGILAAEGIEAYNGGSWTSVSRFVQ